MVNPVTKESLAARIADLESGARSLKEDYTLAAYKMLLATMEAEPVAEITEDLGRLFVKTHYPTTLIAGDKLYRHAQPAPVVPDKMTAIVKDEAEYVEGWNDCRAAMLQAEPVMTSNKLPGAQFKQVADLYEMQFDDGRTFAFHTDAEKAAQWLNTCDGNKVQEYVKLERLHDAVSGNSPVIPGKWIPVSERMPVEFEAVIAFDGDQVYGEAMYSSDDGFTIDGYDPSDRVQLQSVTHWMPLPAVPVK